MFGKLREPFSDGPVERISQPSPRCIRLQCEHLQALEKTQTFLFDPTQTMTPSTLFLITLTVTTALILIYRVLGVSDTNQPLPIPTLCRSLPNTPLDYFPKSGTLFLRFGNLLLFSNPGVEVGNPPPDSLYSWEVFDATNLSDGSTTFSLRAWKSGIASVLTSNIDGTLEATVEPVANSVFRAYPCGVISESTGTRFLSPSGVLTSVLTPGWTWPAAVELPKGLFCTVSSDCWSDGSYGKMCLGGKCSDPCRSGISFAPTPSDGTSFTLGPKSGGVLVSLRGYPVVGSGSGLVWTWNANGFLGTLSTTIGGEEMFLTRLSSGVGLSPEPTSLWGMVSCGLIGEPTGSSVLSAENSTLSMVPLTTSSASNPKTIWVFSSVNPESLAPLRSAQ